ncbi:MAG: nitrite reductase (NAD(P)H) small subunit, partial [Fuerstiella sp.]|nr:nitrite reductase (NAD(P)H) small subunit [Fuerstiella sp.]
GSVTGDVSHCPVGETQQYFRDGEILRCPWHGWQFDLSTGRSLVDPERTRVRSYPVRVEQDRVLVALRQS